MVSDKITIVLLGWLIFFPSFLSAEKTAENKKGKFLFSPMAGVISNEVCYHISGLSGQQTMKDDGSLYGVYMMYVKPDLIIGSLSHYAELDKTNENGNLFFLHYYFRSNAKIQPTCGINAENIRVYSELLQEDVYPLPSLDVTVNVWAFNPVAGISYKDYFLNNTSYFRITPFIGYFNEQVGVCVSSPGMSIAGQNRNGFKSDSGLQLDYISVGTKCIIDLFHIIHVDSKWYVRMRKDDESYYTVRNRLDVYFSKKIGLSVKYDYFQDEYDTNTFLFFGPSFVF